VSFKSTRYLGDVSARGLKGEAHFGWVLEERAVRDVWTYVGRTKFVVGGNVGFVKTYKQRHSPSVQLAPLNEIQLLLYSTLEDVKTIAIRCSQLSEGQAKLLRVERTVIVLIPLTEVLVQEIVEFLKSNYSILVGIGCCQNVLGQLTRRRELVGRGSQSSRWLRHRQNVLDAIQELGLV